MKIARTWDDKWHWYTPRKNGLVGNYYEPSRSRLGALVDYFLWRLDEARETVSKLLSVLRGNGM